MAKNTGNGRDLHDLLVLEHLSLQKQLLQVLGLVVVHPRLVHALVSLLVLRLVLLLLLGKISSGPMNRIIHPLVLSIKKIIGIGPGMVH